MIYSPRAGYPRCTQHGHKDFFFCFETLFCAKSSCINKLGHHSLGTAHGDSDEKPVSGFSVTTASFARTMRWIAAMKEQLISQF